MKLLQTQKNEIFDLIEVSGFVPSQFKFIEHQNSFQGNYTTKLNYKNTDFYFLFENGLNEYLSHILYSPGDNKYQSGANILKWNDVIHYFRNWLNFLKREINAPDKWGRLQKEIEYLDLEYNNDDNKFSASEYKDLKIKINTLKEHLSEIQLLPEQIKIIDAKLDHITDLAISLNKFDWKNLFIGSVIAVIIQLSLTPDSAKALWDLIRGIFNNYFLH